jgi:hypothetical protein
VGGNSFILVILAVLGIGKQIRIKEPLVFGIFIKKIRIKEPLVLSISKNHKESPNFMKETHGFPTSYLRAMIVFHD